MSLIDELNMGQNDPEKACEMFLLPVPVVGEWFSRWVWDVALVFGDERFRKWERVGFADGVHRLHPHHVLLLVDEAVDGDLEVGGDVGLDPGPPGHVHLLDQVVGDRGAAVVRRLAPGQIARARRHSWINKTNT